MIKVYSNLHCAFAANHLVQQLQKLGHEAKIIEEWDVSDDSLHILYQVAHKWNMPKNYIVQQTEPWNSHWFSDHYRDKVLKNALAVWEYNEDNFKGYDHPNKCTVSPGIFPKSHKTKDIGRLFYGHIEGSKNRRDSLEELQKQYDIKLITDTTGPEMWKLLQRTRDVINIHYLPNSPLEWYRIYESISHGCRVWLHDEQCFVHDSWLTHDNLPQIKHGLSLVGL